ncbi:hypothetical protein V8F20_010672 [Naviculisporaceae sp. PSN 640]
METAAPRITSNPFELDLPWRPWNGRYVQTLTTSAEWIQSCQTYRIDLEILGDDKATRSWSLMTAQGDDGDDFLRTTYESMNTLWSIVPRHSNQFHARGTYISDPNTHFLLYSYGYKTLALNYGDWSAVGHALADLHLKSRDYIGYPPKNRRDTRFFGYHRQTSTRVFREHRGRALTWSDFFIKQLRTMLQSVIEAWAQYKPEEACNERDLTCNMLDELAGPLFDVAARLVHPLELDGRRSIKPVLLHGALSQSNIPKEVGGEKDQSPIFINGAVFWGHNDLGCLLCDFENQRGLRPAELIMKAYHEKIPKDKPEEDYQDRLRLYGLRTLMYKSATDPGNIQRRNWLLNAIKFMVDKYKHEG